MEVNPGRLWACNVNIISCLFMFVHVMQGSQTFTLNISKEVHILNNLTTHLHVYSTLILVNGHIEMQVSKLNIYIFSVQVYNLFVFYFFIFFLLLAFYQITANPLQSYNNPSLRNLCVMCRLFYDVDIKRLKIFLYQYTTFNGKFKTVWFLKK